MTRTILSGGTLRPARSNDVRAVRAVLTAAANDLTARFGEGHWSGVRSVESLRKYVDEGTLYIVELDARVAGTLRLSAHKIGFYRNDWFADPSAEAGYLLDMAMDPAHRRRGIGRQALTSAERIAQAAGLQAIRLDAYTGLAGVGEFYRHCGYRLMHQGEFRGVGLEYCEKLL